MQHSMDNKQNITHTYTTHIMLSNTHILTDTYTNKHTHIRTYIHNLQRLLDYQLILTILSMWQQCKKMVRLERILDY